MTDGNYCANVTTGGVSGSPRSATIQGNTVAGSIEVFTRNSSLSPEDHTQVAVAVFR